MLLKLLWLLYEFFKILFVNNMELNIYKEFILVSGFFYGYFVEVVLDLYCVVNYCRMDIVFGVKL